MKITDIKIRQMQAEADNRMRAIVSVTFDNLLAVHDLRIVLGKERLFVAMPSRKSNDGIYKDIVHPINASFRQYVEESILERYQEELTKE